ncbi:low molecular weight phosphatase family protein [Nocardioides aurantiacus]|uniref:Protein-tyrosine phosphatase n=1 Tax=Nocardioides aurantiacus TaxID=86796 RepID=A0A3N2CYI0_9ACTN|nr:low molecular weight phosphatase family protein [Nocardioides aurantiacus]ROR92513.1 protein-tyrosine phosphatase [Nocardioides aurantiacus]
MAAYRVLVVCVGNVCRSPLGERLLAARLGEGFEVSSAGVGALVGEPMDPEAAAHLERLGGSADGFAARQLTDAIVRDADLVLTATKEVRARVLQESPVALRRTFTLRELAALVDVVGPQPDPASLVAAAGRERSRAALEEYDVADPFRRGDEAHALAAGQVDEAVTRIAAALGAPTG